MSLERMRRLENENIMLKLKNKQLKLEIKELNNEWAHPRSCLHNDDPWEHLAP